MRYYLNFLVTIWSYKKLSGFMSIHETDYRALLWSHTNVFERIIKLVRSSSEDNEFQDSSENRSSLNTLMISLVVKTRTTSCFVRCASSDQIIAD